MYFNDGINSNEIGDFEVVEKGGQLHLFYLSLPSHDAVGHLVSDNGIDWRPLPVAIRTGEPGEFDSDQIWTMGVQPPSAGTVWKMNLGRERFVQNADVSDPELSLWSPNFERRVFNSFESFGDAVFR